MKLSKTIPKYFQEEKVKNFTGIEIEQVRTIGNGGILKFDWLNSQREMTFTAPKRGRLIGGKSYLVLDITTTGTGSAPFDYVQSLFSNKYYLVNGRKVCNNNSNWGYFHSLMSSVHYDSDYVNGSSGYKTGVSLSSLTDGNTQRVFLPLVNPKYQDHEDLLKDSFDLSSVDLFEVVYQISPVLSDLVSGASATDIQITATMYWHIVHSKVLDSLTMMKPITKSYTRYHFERRIVESGVSQIEHTFVPKFSNLKYIILAQRTSAVANGTGTDKYTANFVQSAIDELNVYIDGKPVWNNNLELHDGTNPIAPTYIDLMEKTFSRDYKKALGSYMDFTNTANTGKMVLALPLSLDTKHSSGKNTKSKNKSVVVKANTTIAEQTHFDYFLVYDEVAVVNPINKSFNVLS